jgi:hypothetical protein
VHRYVAFVRSSLGKCEGEASHLEHAVAANAGSYTCPTFEENFPFGFGEKGQAFQNRHLNAVEK